MGADREEFRPSTRPPEVGWARAGVMPPAPLYIHRDDALNIESWGSLAGANLFVRARIMLPDGTMTQLIFQHAPNADRTRASSDHEMTEGWLFSLLIEESTGVGRRGQIWMRAKLIRGPGATALSHQVLCEGYAGAFLPVWWPPGLQNQSIEGPGIIRSITGTNPAAGVEITEVVPSNARWRLLGVAATLVTSVAVANRLVQWIIDDGAITVFHTATADAQVASQTVVHVFSTNQGNNSAGIVIFARAPHPGYLLQGFRVRTQTRDLQAGDNWGAPQLWVEEWIEE